MTIEANWHDDGHIIHLELVRNEAQITSVTCPGGDCHHPYASCVVRYFLEVYGLECNVGICPMAADIVVAWTLIGSPSDLDASQLWVIPTSDEIFQAWISG